MLRSNDSNDAGRDRRERTRLNRVFLFAVISLAHRGHKMREYKKGSGFNRCLLQF
jgi:hypothetical protein